MAGADIRWVYSKLHRYIRTYIGIFETQTVKSNLDGIWQIEYGENIAIFDIHFLNFEYMVKRRTPQISNIAKFHIRRAMYIRI